jgi:hypothetical protein
MKNSLAALLILGFAHPARAVDEPAHNVASTNVARLSSAYINQLAEEMRANHPALRAVGARARAAAFGTNAVRTWEDPMFLFGGSVASTRGFDPAEDGDLIYGLEQKLPLFGKAAAVRRVAQAEAETERARITWQFQTLRRDLAKALFRAAYAEQVIAVGTQDLAWMDTMVSTMEERYRAGSATQVEVLRLQNERAKRIEQLRTDTRRRDYGLVTVNRFLGRSLNGPLPLFELPSPAGRSMNEAPGGTGGEVRASSVMERNEMAWAGVADAQVATARHQRLGGRTAMQRRRQLPRAFAVKLIALVQWRKTSDVARDRSRVEAAELEAADYSSDPAGSASTRYQHRCGAARRCSIMTDPALHRAGGNAHANWLAGPGVCLM